MLNKKKFVGEEIQTIQKALAKLRIQVFRDFPYLYEGSLAYEGKYLERYIQSPKAAVIAVFDDGDLVGAATVLPLSDETEAVQTPFVKAGLNISEIYYFGESILLSKYRGQGLGHYFFDEREKHAKLDPKCKITSFCAVNRPADHPMKPDGYRPLDEFWKSRGYKKNSDLQASFSWQDIGEAKETEKTMTFWLREI